MKYDLTSLGLLESRESMARGRQRLACSLESFLDAGSELGSRSIFVCWGGGGVGAVGAEALSEFSLEAI